MTVTDTVTSFAQDAAHAAEDLGKQAIQLGRTAVAAGSDVASSAASHASHLVHDVAKDVRKKVPTQLRAKKKTPWKAYLGVGVLVVVLAMVARRKRAATHQTSHTPTSSHAHSTQPSRPDLRSTSANAEAAAS